MQYLLFTIIILGVALIAYRALRKDKIRVFPNEWVGLLNTHVQFYTHLSAAKQLEFKERMLAFLNDIYIEGVHLELKPLDSVLIAASAIIPVFGFKDWKYRNLKTVLLYPDYFDDDLNFDKNAEGKNIAGMVGTGHFNRQMILSRKALYKGFKNSKDKRNTAIHEFVHLLDMFDGMTDGIPHGLLPYQYTIPWIHLMHEEIQAIRNNESSIRPYGGTEETEFFAVVSEYFFERPNLLEKNHPELYELLTLCFQQDLSTR